jgi:hypothetical protein
VARHDVRHEGWPAQMRPWRGGRAKEAKEAKKAPRGVPHPGAASFASFASFAGRVRSRPARGSAAARPVGPESGPDASEGRAEREAVQVESELPAGGRPERGRRDRMQRRIVRGLPDAAVRRPPAWSDPGAPPTPACRCARCGGRRWFRARMTTRARIGANAPASDPNRTSQ